MATYFQCYDAADESSSCCVLSSHRSYSIDRLVIKAQKEVSSMWSRYVFAIGLYKQTEKKYFGKYTLYSAS